MPLSQLLRVPEKGQRLSGLSNITGLVSGRVGNSPPHALLSQGTHAGSG